MTRITVASAVAAAVAATLAFAACNNFFHELIPPDGDRITAFEVPGQVGSAVIGDGTVTVKVMPGTDVSSLLPRVTVSRGAVVMPVTFEYVTAAFPEADLITAFMDMHTAPDFQGLVFDLIRGTPGFSIPPLEMPVNFTGPVTFFVIAGQGNVRQYSVNVEVYDDGPLLLGFRFAKYDNPQILSDAVPVFTGRSMAVTAMYPVEIPDLSFELIPSFRILGDGLAVDGVAFASGEDAIRFDPVLNVPQTRTVTVTRGGISRDYRLTVTFREDPDTIRSITDFRFNWAENTAIAATAVASIVNDGDYGTIRLNVLYEGTRPATLRPRFVSPGTVRVGGTVQNSGVDAHDFYRPLYYRVTSRDGRFTRTYTVQTTFTRISREVPRMLSFGLSRAHNPGLIRDSAANITDGHIVIDLHFGGTAAPQTLIPEFAAEGTVTVLGSVQTSGASEQDFSRRIIYRVTNPLDPSLWREYSVQTRLVRDTSSDAVMISFGFFPEDGNGGLTEPLAGRIQQDRITVFAPEGFGVSTTTMIPRFEATGPVSVAGTVQTSGISGRVFYAPVRFTVTSPNGANTRTYEVMVRELPAPRIFVDAAATGWNDGTSWQDAFRCLRDAAVAALAFPQDWRKEIWIAAGTYSPANAAGDFVPIPPNTRFIGGFAGNETEVSRRNVTANRTVVTGGGLPSAVLFRTPYGTAEIGGDAAFEDMEFYRAATAVDARFGADADFTVSGAAFTAMGGDALRLSGGSRVSLGNVALRDVAGSALVIGAAGRVEIDGIEIGGITGSGITFAGFSGEAVIERARLTGVAGDGLRFFGGGAGSARLYGIRAEDIGGRGIALEFVGTGFVIAGVEMHDVRGTSAVAVDGVSGGVEIRDADLRGVTGAGLWFSGGSGSRRLYGITVNNAGGSGISINHSNTAFVITDSEITDIRGTAGIAVTGGSGDVDIYGANIAGVAVHAVWFSGNTGDRRIEGVTANNVGNNGISILGAGSGGISITGGRLTGIRGNNAINVTNSSGFAGITGVYIRGVTGNIGRGIMFGNSTGTVEITDTEVRNIATGMGIQFSGGGGRITLDGVTVENVGGIGSGIDTIAFNGGPLYILNTEVRNVSGGAVSLHGDLGDVAVTTAVIEGAGRGVFVSGGTGSRTITGVTGTGIGRGGIEVIHSNTGADTFGATVIRSAKLSGVNNGPAISVTDTSNSGTPGDVEIAATYIRGVNTGHGISVVARAGNRNVSIFGTEIRGLTGAVASTRAISVTGSPGDVEVTGAVLRDISGYGVRVEGGNGSRAITGVDGERLGRAGIFVNNAGTSGATIRATRMHDLAAGPAVHVAGTHGNVTVDGADIFDIRGTGIYFAYMSGAAPGRLVTIRNSVVKNTGWGLIANVTNGELLVEGTDFINNSNERGSIVSVGSADTARFRESSFIHTDDFQAAATVDIARLFSFTTMLIEFYDCDFVNLTGTAPDSYGFILGNINNFGGSNVGSSTVSEWEMRLRNSRFVLRPGERMGVVGVATTPGSATPSLLIDGITVTANGIGQPQPLIWLQGNNAASTFTFRGSNFVNGVPLNPAAQATLAQGLVRLTGNAQQRVVVE